MEEWWNSDNHLVDKDTKSPPVDCVVVSSAEQHLGGEVLSGAAERICQLTILNELSKAEVGH